LFSVISSIAIIPLRIRIVKVIDKGGLLVIDKGGLLFKSSCPIVDRITISRSIFISSLNFIANRATYTIIGISWLVIVSTFLAGYVAYASRDIFVRTIYARTKLKQIKRVSQIT
jgi:hypothetical protein